MGEYQSAELDDTDTKVDQLRAGIGYRFPTESAIQFNVDLQYADLELDFPGLGTAEDDGFIAHAGATLTASPALSFFGEFGLIQFGDSDGNEFRIGARFAFSPTVSGFADYRSSKLDIDGGDEADLADFRLGIGFHF